MIQPTLINLHPNEYTKWLRCYPFSVNLGRFMESFNALNNLSNRICVPNKTEASKLIAFNMITEINESKILTKHISCECKCNFDGIKCNSTENWNKD